MVHISMAAHGTRNVHPQTCGCNARRSFSRVVTHQASAYPHYSATDTPHSCRTSIFTGTLQQQQHPRHAVTRGAQPTTTTTSTAPWVMIDLKHVAAGQLFRGTLPDGKTCWLEVVAAPVPGTRTFHAHMPDGQLVSVDVDEAVTVTPLGFCLDLRSSWLEGYPGWVPLLTNYQQTLPNRDSPRPLLLQSLEQVGSFEGLLSRVRTNPQLWCAGTAADDPPLTEEQTMTLTAGEIIALLEGKRAVVMVQLWVGWSADAPQPVFRPFVLRLLRTAVLDPRIAVHMSAVPVGAELGLTAILAADTPPYCAWGSGLAEFGAQAAIEAQSPYYKLLIGRVLGYELENIRAHVEEGGEALESVTEALVESELLRLSDAEPLLPWWHRHDPEAIVRVVKERGGSGRKRGQQQAKGAPVSSSGKGFGGSKGGGGKRGKGGKKK